MNIKLPNYQKVEKIGIDSNGILPKESRLIGNLCLILLIIPFTNYAQLSINSSITPQQLVEDFLIGEGIQVSNVTLGAQTQVSQLGTFINNNTNLGLSNGIILSTGYSDDASINGINFNSSFTSSSPSCTGGASGLCLAGDSDLNAIVGTNTQDAAVLEFDFIPLSDTVRFRYVFASEEYNEYVCSQFNDVFAFLLTGPGVNNQNIARIPNTNIPVAINAVNSGFVGFFGAIANCSGTNGSLNYSNYFVDNSGAPFVQFDGMTTVLEAMAVVQPCQTYHIKLAIADVIDGALDSGVFLEANSFTSPLPNITVQTANNDSIIIEGCNTAEVTFTYNTPLNTNQTFNYNILGTATNSVDFNNLSGSVTIPSGQNTASIDILPIADGIQEGEETIFIEIELAPCLKDTVFFILKDEEILNEPTVTCNTANAISITYSWNAITNATGYRVSTDNGATWDTLDVGTLDFTIYNLNNGASQSLAVQAIGGFPFCNSHPIGTAICSTLTCNLSGSFSNIINTTCYNGNDGSVTITPINGNAPFKYVLDNSLSQNSPVFQSLTSGNHIVTIIDKDSCMADVTFAIGEPSEITISGNGVLLPSCSYSSDGAVQLTATNGFGTNYIYTVNGVTNNTGYFDSLAVGTHIVSVIDENNCLKIDSFFVTGPAAINLNASSTMAKCTNEANGSATILPTGGTIANDYSYQWSNNQMTATINNVSSATYSVTVTDDNGCRDSTTVPVLEPDSIQFLNVITTPTSCFGASDGTASISVIGGTGSYHYRWNTGDTTANLNNKTAGNYSVSVTDANGCTDSLTLTINQPQEILITNIEIQHVTCNGAANGTATIQTNSTSALTYLWQPSFQNTQTATGLDVGLYEIAVTDASGCIVKDTIEIEQPTAISSLIQETQSASCFNASDGAAQVTASGGTPNDNENYNFIWNSSPSQNGIVAQNLTGGTQYTVTITDSLGCQATNSIIISQPQDINIMTTVSDVLCNGGNDGAVITTINGGTPSFQYQWSINQNTGDLNNVPAGTYTLTVTDFNNCTKVKNVTIEEPPAIDLLLQKQDVFCKGEATGKASALVTGGVAPYDFQWNDNQTSSSIENLLASQYEVTVTDANLCTETAIIEITQPSVALCFAFRKENVSCFGGRNGQLSLEGIGGKPPYQYSTDGSDFTNSNILIGLTANTYIPTIKDDNGCTYDTIAVITQPNELTIDAGDDKFIELGEEIQLSTIITNTETALTYKWSPSVALSCDDCEAPIASPTQEQFYTVQVTDESGCTASDLIAVRVGKNQNIYVATAFTPNGDAVNDYAFIQSEGDLVESIVFFQIFDRWGEKVFEASEVEPNIPSLGWNGFYKGKVANSGVYGWQAEVLFSDGEKRIFKGNITLVR